MSTDPFPPRSIPFGTIALLALATVLDVVMLANIRFSAGGGDAIVGEAIAQLTFTFFLWVALALLTIAGAVMGHMPRWAAIALFILVPFSGVATFIAIDMCSRHIRWAILFPIALPLLLAAYAMWARFSQVHANLRANDVSIVALGLIFVLSVAASVLAAVF